MLQALTGRPRPASISGSKSKDEGAGGDLDLRDDLQRIALEFPCYGRPGITVALRRRGWTVNHKRAGRIMREEDALSLGTPQLHCICNA